MIRIKVLFLPYLCLVAFALSAMVNPTKSSDKAHISIEHSSNNTNSHKQKNYYNQQISSTLSKNNCSPGYNGSSSTYTVYAGTYFSTISQADADQLAQNDVNANAQNYANTNGTCTISQTNTVTINYDTPSDKSFIIETYHWHTGTSNYYTISGSGSLSNIPGGYRAIYITSAGTDNTEYDIYFQEPNVLWGGRGTLPWYFAFIDILTGTRTLTISYPPQ